uniref:Insertion element IS150 protein InsJ-like helix-turn-helix domain-containing protein n=1 Tax=Oncorhynchus tshawytscha TaxID=74940 RepID=A0AAZ3S1X7_ONCTS
MPRVPAHLCERALGMLQGGMRSADVARALNCNVRTVRRLRQCYRETGRTADRPRSGRPRVTTPAQDRYIRTSHLQDRYRMATTTGRVTSGTHNPSISAQTVLTRLREAGLRACRPVVRQDLTGNNVAYGHKHTFAGPDRTGKKCSSVTSRGLVSPGGDGRIRVYRQRNARYTEACTLERDRFGGGGSVMVWGGVSQHHRTELVVIAGNLNAVRYREDILLHHVVPSL